MYVCVASRWLSVWGGGGPFNWYDFFDTWGRGEGGTLPRRVVSTQCAEGLSRT